MINPFSSVDPQNGNVIWDGPLTTMKGDHSHMPPRTEAYLPGDERGHLNASSLGGGNSRSNVVPQNSNVNHRAYSSMERGERRALQNGAEIHSVKTAIVNGQPGDRPEAFLVSDTVNYADGHTESIHLSFANESYADQAAWNEQSASLPGVYDAPNPGDGLRESMGTEAYSELMESTDAELPGIAENYAAADYSGDPEAESPAASSTPDSDAADAGTESGADADAAADTD